MDKKISEALKDKKSKKRKRRRETSSSSSSSSSNSKSSEDIRKKNRKFARDTSSDREHVKDKDRHSHNETEDEVETSDTRSTHPRQKFMKENYEIQIKNDYYKKEAKESEPEKNMEAGTSKEEENNRYNESENVEEFHINDVNTIKGFYAFIRYMAKKQAPPAYILNNKRTCNQYNSGQPCYNRKGMHFKSGIAMCTNHFYKHHFHVCEHCLEELKIPVEHPLSECPVKIIIQNTN